MKVDIWKEQVIIPTYKAGEPDKNPMFFEKRVYQGSSGVVYPNPVIEKISDEKVDQEYTALFLENRYLKVMILPQLGGRVQMAYDKIAQRHFIYYNSVIKPALVGLCGPWISGGIEFNWPQHHRPSTFEPVDYTLVENADGSKTIWVNEIEKMFHTKGMAGFTLYPDKAYLEIKAQVYNRTHLPQTFLWWANPAVKVNDYYQSVFPPDVNAVFDHGKRDVSSFPIATGTYYKVNYAPGTDISRYKNIPVPTSYMAVNSRYDFMGGYEHDTRAGMLHVADHHVSPGKKQWTWGHGDFGKAWDRNLTDEDGPYIELMAGVFTDNQPDFTWLMPHEEKSFTQYFLPYRELGLVKNASKDILVGWETKENSLTIKIMATSVQPDINLNLFENGKVVWKQTLTLTPEEVFENDIIFYNPVDENSLLLSITKNGGEELLRYEPVLNNIHDLPEPAKPAPLPHEVETIEQLFLTGQHLEQYRHATFNPVDYYREALKRDPGDSRCNNALGAWYLRRGRFAESEVYFRAAIARIIQYNPNPYDTEPYYNLGLALNWQGNQVEAYDAFFKATWSSAWQASAYFAITQIDIARGHYEQALKHINWSIDCNARNGKAYLAKIHALVGLGHLNEAIATANEALQLDNFNLSVWFELYNCYNNLGDSGQADATISKMLNLCKNNPFALIDISIEFAELGLYKQAGDLLRYIPGQLADDPMLNYYRAYYTSKLGEDQAAAKYFETAAVSNQEAIFPNRLYDILVLQNAKNASPADWRIPYGLGNLWYDKRQYNEAVYEWEITATLNDKFPRVFRNMAIAAFNKQNDPAKALSYYEKAYTLNANDGRTLMELDQLYKRLNYTPERRLTFLNDHTDVVCQRDDLYLETAALHNFTGQYQLAYDMLMRHKFNPWEGGEGKVSGQYVYSLVEMAKEHLNLKQYHEALDKLQQAQAYPINLGEGKLAGTQENDIFYWIGCAYEGLNQPEEAIQYWLKATEGVSELNPAIFYNDQQPDKIFYQGLAWLKLGEADKGADIFERLIDYGRLHENDEVKIDYFAISLPDMLIFDDDLVKRNKVHCSCLVGLGYLGLGKYVLAKDIFNNVLMRDAMHFGAQSHLNLIDVMQKANHEN